MAEFTYKDLENVRKSRKMTRWQLANEIGVSEDTLGRWETGKSEPGIDDVWNIERVLGIPGLWHKWMRSHYDSYREKFGEVENIDNITAMVSQSRYEVSDIVPLLEIMERDSLDGKFDKPEQWNKFKKEAPEAIAALQQLLDRIPKEI